MLFFRIPRMFPLGGRIVAFQRRIHLVHRRGRSLP